MQVQIRKAAVFSKCLSFLSSSNFWIWIAESTCSISKLWCFLWPLPKCSNHANREHKVQKAEGNQKRELKPRQVCSPSPRHQHDVRCHQGQWGNACPFRRTDLNSTLIIFGYLMQVNKEIKKLKIFAGWGNQNL